MKYRGSLACWLLAACAMGALPSRKARRIEAASSTVSWRGEVAPQLYAHCAACHHAGGSAPFALTTYAEAKRWGPQIVEVTANRYMPPWLPEPTAGPHVVHFEGDRRLSDATIEMFARWVKEGMPEGTGTAPEAPTFSAGWQMGPPDLVLEMPVAVTVPASGSDAFVNFVLPAQLAATRWIRAMEIQPGAGSLVHHANVLIDRTRSLRAAHPQSWEQGVPGMDLRIDSGDAFDPDSHFLFWKPDSTALVEPPGMPWRLDPGNDLILNMHLKPTGKPEQVRARIGLYFTAEPARAKPILVELEHDAALQIPAGDQNFVVSDELKLPVAADLLGVYPHAHYLGHTMEAWATLPGGVRQPILHIKDWDIDRQAVYPLTEPLSLPAGTVLHMRYTYDNSAANARNPHTPPLPVHAGNRATDEMGHLWLQLLPHGDGQADARLPVERAWMEAILRKSPRDALALYNLGALEQMQGEPEQAAGHFRRVLADNPGDGRALTALGSALEAQGDVAGASEAFQAALKVNGADADALFDLATLELKTGNNPSAERLFRTLLEQHGNDAAAQIGLAEALTNQSRYSEAETTLQPVILQQPQDAAAHRVLAMAYAGEGRMQETVAQLRLWAQLTPGQPEAHRALAQVLSAANDGAGAIAEQQLVVTLVPKGAGDWNDLGVLEARAGQGAKAREAFLRALALEPGSGSAKANLERLGAATGQR